MQLLQHYKQWTVGMHDVLNEERAKWTKHRQYPSPVSKGSFAALKRRVNAGNLNAYKGSLSSSKKKVQPKVRYDNRLNGYVQQRQ